MRKLKERFHRKHGIVSRIFSMVLALAMIVTMVPAIGGATTAYAGDNDVTITLHFKNYGDWNEVATKATETESWTSISGYEQYNAWPGVVLSEDADHQGYYTLTVTKGTDTQFNCIFTNNVAEGGSQTSNIIIPASELAGKTSYEGWVIDSSGEILKSAPNSWTTPGASDLSYVSPEVNGRKVTFRVPESKFPRAGKVTVPGDMNNWNISEEKGSYVLTKNDAGMWTGTFTMAPGVYGYKFAADESWTGSMTDPANSATTNGNSKLVVPGLEDKVIDAVKKNEATELPATLKCYAEDGTVTDAPVTYSLKAGDENVSLSGNTITVDGAYDGTTLVLDAKTSDGKQSTVTLNLVDKTYTYTIYYYDFNEAHMSTSATDLWVWEKGGAGPKEGTAFTDTEVLDDGNTWLKTVVTLSYTNVNIISRSAGGWDWQNDTIEYANTAEDENVTLYITSNSKEAYTSIPELVKPRERYVMVEYDRPAGDYDGWNIFTWNSGFGSEVTINLQEMNGKMVAKIPVKDSTADLMLSFCMRRSTADDAWAEKDGGDHYVNVPANQTVVKAKFEQGEGITEVLPYNTGYEMDGENGQIHFYYRNDEMVAADNTQKSIADKVSITINGEEHAMTYDAANERFSYDLSGITTGDYCYYYTVDGEEKLDAFNENTKDYAGKTCSVCHYKKFNMNISAELSQPTMDYNDNNVLTIKNNPADGEDMTGFEVATATADLSALGLSSEYAIDPALMEVTISCLNTTTTGVKTIPVTVKDVYGNVYTTEVNVTVTDRVKTDGDFDWDEAVVYFAVTDRFFDGDTSNNDAYGVGDYNTGDKGGSSYHGGDFAGLNEKLDYLKDLGVNTIWITPIVENITEDQHDAKTDTATYGYHGYWASDFTEINKHLGTKEEFATLLDAAHSRGMKLMVDVVLNHAGYGTEDYFNNILTDEDGNAVKMLRDSSNTVSGDDKLAPLSDLPDFVTEDPEVRDQLIEWQTDWMDEFDIDYYRVDTVKHVDSTTWAAFKNSLTKVNPDFKMIGEYSGAGYANTAGELGTGSMDALLDFDFNDFAQNFVGGNISNVESSLQKRNAALNNTATMGSFLSSHDEDSLQYKLVNESGFSEEEAYNLMKVAATLQITAKGQPVIYYGEEIGLGGANNWPLQTNRRDFDWTELENQKADSNSIYNHYKTMLAIRNAYTDVFARGDRATVAASDADGYEVISRSYADDTLYVGMNIKETAKEVTIPVSEDAGSVVKNLYDGKEYTVSADKTVTVTIPATKDGGTVVLTKEKQEDNINLDITVPGKDFEEVIDTIGKVDDGTNIRVTMPDTTTVPAEVFNSMIGKDITITFKLNDNVSWIVNGKNIVSKLKDAVDLGVTVGKSSIPADKIKALAGDNKTIELSLAHDGAFGFDATLRINVGAENNGKYANLYYYNEKTGALEYVQAVKVNADGTVDFKFSHASDYVIVLSDADMKPAASTTPNATPTVNAQPQIKTGDNTPIAYTVVLLFVAGAAVVVLYRRRKRV
ncbi:alpha-amylase family glycosyl hydrolase [Thermoguttaceae bacterium LCP21S3_D4]